MWNVECGIKERLRRLKFPQLTDILHSPHVPQLRRGEHCEPACRSRTMFPRSTTRRGVTGEELGIRSEELWNAFGGHNFLSCPPYTPPLSKGRGTGLPVEGFGQVNNE